MQAFPNDLSSAQITLMCLLEMVHGLPADSRTIALPSIASATKLSVDGVEFLLMKALSLHLIEGVIDQVCPRRDCC